MIPFSLREWTQSLLTSSRRPVVRRRKASQVRTLPQQAIVETLEARVVLAVTQLGSGAAQFLNSGTLGSFTAEGGADLLLVVTASDSNATDITGVTWLGQPMTQAVEVSDGTAVDSIWYLPLGSFIGSRVGDIVMTSNAVAGTHQRYLSAVVFAGVNQSTPTSSPAQNASTSNAGSGLNMTSAAGDLVYDVFSTFHNSLTPTLNVGANQTQVATAGGGITGGPQVGGGIDSANRFGTYANSREAGAASVTMSWTSNADAFIHLALNIQQSVAAVAPTVTTPTSASITNSTATLGGNVTSDGGATITERGVVYSLTSVDSDPNLGEPNVFNATTSGTTGVFTVNVSGLTAASGYSFKAYAMNSVGPSYSPVATFTTLGLDFGDAPTGYPVTLAENGAQHLATGPTLGATRDSEADGTHAANADADGADEDGITAAGPLVVGQTTNITINVQGGGGFVNAWADLNRDGDWDDVGEQFLTNLPVNVGDNTIPFAVPNGFTPGDIVVRYRLTSASVASPSPTGLLPDGEVEDYVGTVYGYDFGDLPDLTPGTGPGDYQTLAAHGGPSHLLLSTSLRFGQFNQPAPDVEPDGQPNALATGDNSVGNNDEQGVFLPSVFTVGNTVQVAIPYSNFNTSLDATIKGFVDWNGNGVFTDPGESYVNTVPGGAGGNTSLFITAPGNAVLNTPLGARFRISSDPNLTANGPAPDGEVEDYMITVVPGIDFGDAPTGYPVTIAENGARHTAVGPTLGATRDIEPDGTHSAGADADGADEDGITAAGPLVVGQTTDITINVQGSAGFVNAWADLNRDGDFDDVLFGEQFLTNHPVVVGANVIPFDVPNGFTLGDIVVRYRLTSQSVVNPLPTGLLPDGEVEDYVGTIVEAPSLIVTTATDVVNNTDGLTSLREAIAYAAILPGADTITFGDGSAITGGTNFTDATADTITKTGIYFQLNSDVTIVAPGASRLTLNVNSGNGFVILSGVTAEIIGLTITGGGATAGGGIFNRGTLTLRQCTLFNNYAEFAGSAIYNADGSLFVTQSTISGNDDNSGEAGAVNSSGGSVRISQSTITGNESGVTIQNGAFEITNSIIAGNGVDFVGISATSAFNNLVGDPSAAGGIVHGTNGNIVGKSDGASGRILLPIAEVLNPTLADNGGPTQTHALINGSPAINAGDNTRATTNGQVGGTALITDQRGSGFARVVGPAVDMGAFEQANSRPTGVTLSNSIIAENAGANALVGILIGVDPDSNDTFTFTLPAGLTDNSAFRISGNQLQAKASLNFEAKASYTVTVRVRDFGGRTFDQTLNITVTDVNDAPTAVTLSNVVSSLQEDTSTTAALRLADISIADVDGGTNLLSLTGPDAAAFRIVNNRLFLKSGVRLNFVTKPIYNVTVNVDDAAVGGSPDASVGFTLNITSFAPTTVNVTTPTQDMTPTITWSAIPGAVSYDVWITNVSTNTALPTQSVTTNSYTPSTDLGIGRFRVWVRSRNAAGGISRWSTAVTFEVNTPVTLDPIDRRQGTPRPTISWQGLPGAVRYEIYVSSPTISGFLIRDAAITGTEWTPSVDLAVGRYRAWVRGFSAEGKPAMWSRAVDMIADLIVVPAPTLISPLHATFDRTPTFNWSTVSGATSYVLRVRNANTGVVVFEQTSTTTSFTPATSLSDDSYNWEVRAVGQLGHQSSFSTSNRLYVGGRPVIFGPTGTAASSTPTLTWSAVQGAVRYELRLDRTDVVQNRLIVETNLTSPTYTPASALAAGSYRFWVRAVSTSGEFSPWSNISTFSVAEVNEHNQVSPGDVDNEFLFAVLPTFESLLENDRSVINEPSHRQPTNVARSSNESNSRRPVDGRSTTAEYVSLVGTPQADGADIVNQGLVEPQSVQRSRSRDDLLEDENLIDRVMEAIDLLDAGTSERNS